MPKKPSGQTGFCSDLLCIGRFQSANQYMKIESLKPKRFRWPAASLRCSKMPGAGEPACAQNVPRSDPPTLIGLFAARLGSSKAEFQAFDFPTRARIHAKTTRQRIHTSDK